MICIFKLQWKKNNLYTTILFSIFHSPYLFTQTENVEMFRNSGFELYSLSLSIKKKFKIHKYKTNTQEKSNVSKVSN